MTVGFEEEMYSAGESDGVAFVVALVQMGELEASVVINFKTEPLTAESEELLLITGGRMYCTILSFCSPSRLSDC